MKVCLSTSWRRLHKQLLAVDGQWSVRLVGHCGARLVSPPVGSGATPDSSLEPSQRTGAGLAKHILQYPRTVGTERFQLKTISVAGTGTSAKINQPEPRLHRNFDF